MGIMRVHYRERQRLSAEDMRLEQDYRLGLGGRHSLAHHDWGIVRGLRVVMNANGGLLLTPGIAIDGYGREIVVPQELAVDVGGLVAHEVGYVQLYYCEEGRQPTTGISCDGQSAPRIGPRPMVVVANSFAPPAPSSSDLVHARAAGLEGLAPWPVLIAIFDTGMAIDYSLTRYAAHRASAIRAPNARALMQLGLLNRADFYHFLISTRNAASAPGKRIGIDRHGTVHIWRPLCISANRVEARINIGHGLQLRITVPMPADTGSKVTIVGTIDALFNTLTATLHTRGGPPAGSETLAPLSSDHATLVFQDGQRGTAQLFDLKRRLVIRFSAGRRRARRHPEKTITEFSAQFAPLDATLALQNVPPATAEASSPCDIDRMRSGVAESDLSALLFRPVKGIQADPLVREVHAIDTSRPGDLVPGTELRIVGGAADDSDAAARISIGTQVDGSYQAAVHMDGGRRVVIRKLTAQDDGPVLTVRRTAYLPPIGAKDPLLPELLVLAYMTGLRRIGNVAPTVTVTLGPPIDSTGANILDRPGSYHINVQEGSGRLIIKRTMELITGKDGKGDLTFRTLALPDATTPGGARGCNIDLPDLRRTERELEVTVLVLVEIGQKARVAAPAKPSKIPLS